MQRQYYLEKEASTYPIYMCNSIVQKYINIALKNKICIDVKAFY
jgi:hypothetical protein